MLAMPGLRAVFAATQVSPAMKVFTAQQGYETHAARSITWMMPMAVAAPQHRSGSIATSGVPTTAATCMARRSHMAPCCARTRIRAMQESVMHYAFSSPDSLRSDLGIPRDAAELTIHVLPTGRPRDQIWS